MHRCTSNCRKHSPLPPKSPPLMAGFLVVLAAFQQPCELRLKLQSTNGIAVLLAADAGFDDHSQEN